jgi:transposase
MTLFSPQSKHHILTQYRAHSREYSFVALASRYAVKGGESTVRKWYRQWNGSAASLERKKGSGRPRALSEAQVNNLIRTPIRNKNRAHIAVSYTQLLPSVQQKSGKQIALRTVRQYGKRDVGATMKHCKKRMAAESECTHTAEGEQERVCHEQPLAEYS